MSDHETATAAAEVWDLLDADESIAEDIVYLVAAAIAGDAELAAQLDGSGATTARPTDEAASSPPPLRAFLRSITVAGFRGIGPRATLKLPPHYGLTVVSGRNGSGKSSFAEALEYALTGQSYRWVAKQDQHWKLSWRNLHADDANIRIDFAMEADDDRPGATATVGVDWAAGADLDESTRWSQVAGQKRAEVGALGWDQALVTHRPLMSYDELGKSLASTPSKLYDALNELLDLGDITAAVTRLKDAEGRLGEARKRADLSRRELTRALDEASDPRAAQVAKLLKRKQCDLDAINQVALGSTSDHAAAVRQLRSIAEVSVPDVASATAVAAQLRAAIDTQADTSDTATQAIAAHAELLRGALALHTAHGDSRCPVCDTGTLDQPWHVAAEERLREAEVLTAAQHSATQGLREARRTADAFFGTVPTLAPVPGIELETLPRFSAAVSTARNPPPAVADRPAHLEATAAELVAAATDLVEEARRRADELEDAWAPLAGAVAAWVADESQARGSDDQLGRVREANKWLRTNNETLQQRRLAPIVEQSRALWAKMRLESNVDIKAITLTGTTTRRRAILDGTVDGTETGAISVMSQGELHALALALFIPRATTAGSPFRFVVLDDPIQAMDPAKIGGFLDVLIELAKTRQVVVFSHDDRLPAAIRARSVEAYLYDVTREPGSRVAVADNELPALRYVSDAASLVVYGDVDEVVQRQAAPGLFRMAVESAAHQRYFTDRADAGASYLETEQEWQSIHTTQQRVALAVTGNSKGNIKRWKEQRPHRFSTLAVCAHGVHQGAALGQDDITDLRKTVRDIVYNR